MISAKDELSSLKYNHLLNEIREYADISEETLDRLYTVAKAQFQKTPGIVVPSKYSDGDFLTVTDKWEDLNTHMMAILIVRYNTAFFFLEFVKLVKKIGNNG